MGGFVTGVGKGMDVEREAARPLQENGGYLGRLHANQSPQARAGYYNLPPSVTEVGGLEQATIPWGIESGGRTVVCDPDDNLRRNSITWKSRIPKGTERPFDVPFEGKFQGIYLGIWSFFTLE